MIIFIRTDCPISNCYAPEIRRVKEVFGPRKVHFWLVYPEPSERDESFRRALDKQAQQLRTGGYKDVDFGVSLKGGKVSVVARPKK